MRTMESMGKFFISIVRLASVGVLAWILVEIIDQKNHDTEQDASITQALNQYYTLETTVRGIDDTLNRQSDMLEDIIILLTYRNDPWSGEMMIGYHDNFVSILRDLGIDVKDAGLPIVRRIQRAYVEDHPNGLDGQ